ncbi:MAG: ATP-binding protein [Chloroflexi bacterium]|nr:ATP-binding protein [Chloroflexota bacterium]
MSTIPNPYNPQQPTDTPTYFYGRDDALAFFRRQFVGASHRHALVLIGQRGLGKTSLLYQLADQVDDRYRVHIVSLGALDLSSEASLIAGLAEEVRAALELAEASTYRLPAWPTPDVESDLLNSADDEVITTLDLRGWFNTAYLGVALSALRLRHLVLALDDAHLLFDAIARGALPTDLFAYLGELLAAHERLDLILTLDAAYEDRTLAVEVTSDPNLQFRLRALAPDAAAQLVTEPVEGVFDYEPGMAEHILALADGHPFLLHSICRLLYRRSEERHHAGSVLASDLSAIMPAALDQAGDILGPLWDAAPPNERLALNGLIALEQGTPDQGAAFDTLHNWLTGRGYAINSTQLAAALRSLEYSGLVHLDAEGLYRLPIGLLAAWLESNITSGGEEAAATSERSRRARIIPAVGLLAALLVIGALGAAALFGLFDADESENPLDGLPTATLALNLEATRQADFATQTEQARPTPTPTETLTPSRTPTATASATPTPTPSATRTPRASATDEPTATHTPTATQASDTPTRTPRPSRTPTLSPGQ